MSEKLKQYLSIGFSVASIIFSAGATWGIYSKLPSEVAEMRQEVRQEMKALSNKLDTHILDEKDHRVQVAEKIGELRGHIIK